MAPDPQASMDRTDESRSPLTFFLVLLSVAGLTPLGIWGALTFPNVLALALAVPFAALLAWSGTRLVRE